MERNSLNVETREKSGSRDSRRTRNDGRIPGVLYGRGAEPLAISVDVRELRKALSGKSGHNTLLDLKGKGVEGRLAIVKEVQHNPVSGAPMHADLLELKLDQKIHVTVPLHLQGKAKGTVDGGIISTLLRELHIEALPNDIPEAVNVDISDLGIGDSLHIKDLQLPKGVRALGDQVTAVVACVPPAAEKVAEPTAAAPAEPEVLTAKAKEGEAAAPAAGAAKPAAKK